MHKKFDSSAIEGKWQKAWQESGIYKTNESSGKPKTFVLDMFPYPSGEGLHVGHPKGYIATDIYSRFKRMTGHEVLHPMGWDAFGLPAENFAIKHKVHPRAAVEKNVARFKEQLQILGFDYDWDREINTTDPAYYKWTQWIFVQLYKKGLAFESYEPINWCPGCQTGLANEDLESDGTCERCGSMVEKKPMRQWVLKIREYADRMLEDLDTLAWPEHIKEAQRNWIGRSKGAEIDFTLSTGDTVTVFTTRPDTLFGATYVVLAPEHALVQQLFPQLSNKEAAAAYIESAKQKEEKDRLDATKEKTGVKLEGITATNPASGETIPVYIADYVLVAYGTGAIMAVPAHDERDNAFAQKFGLSVRPVIARHFDLGTKEGVETLDRGDVVDLIIEHPTDGTFLLEREADANGPDHVHLVGGGTEGELHEIAIGRELVEETGFTDYELITGPIDIHTALAYRHTKDKNQKTKSHLYHIKLKSLNQVPSELADGKHTIEWVQKEEVAKLITWSGHAAAWNTFATGAGYTGPGTLVQSSPYHIPTKAVFGISEDTEVTREGAYALITDGKGKYLTQFFQTSNYYWLPGGGVDAGETLESTLIREIAEETGYTDITVTHLVDQVYFDFVNGKQQKARNITNVFAVKLNADTQTPLNHTADELSDRMAMTWVTKEDLRTHTSVSDLERTRLILHCIERFEASLRAEENFNGMASETAKVAITEKVGGRMTNTYKIRDWVFSRQRYWGEPIPIIHCDACGAVPVPEAELPVTLPEVEHYEPTGDGQSPLAAITDWVNTTCPTCGKAAKRETNTMPQWAGSSWYYLRYMDPQNSEALVSKDKENYWAPVDVYVGGDHAVRHLIYARFWHKFLYDIGVVSTIEPFQRLEFLGFILAEDGRKMSKRWGNVINPDDIVKLVGADTLRVYEMFMGPFENTIAWSQDGVVGARRFLERVNGLSTHIAATEPEETTSQLHKTIKKVREDIEGFKFNTGISAMMIFINQAEKTGLTHESYQAFLKLLAPFAPHLTDELWAQEGNTASIHTETYPAFDENMAKNKEVTIGVQVNGKLRGNITIAPDATEGTALLAARAEETIAKWLDAPLVKTIYVPGRILNLIVAG